MVQLGFCSKNSKDTLKIFAVDKENLKEFANVSKRYAFENLPENRFRVQKEEQMGSDD